MNIERLKLILDPVAEAIYERIFDERLGPSGTIERAIYRDAAEAGLRAAVGAYQDLGKTS